MVGFTFHQVDVFAGVGQGERGIDTGNSASHHQHVGVNGHLPALQGDVPLDAPHGGADQVHGLGGGRLMIGVHPGVVLPEVDHMEVVRVETRLADRLPEGVFVQVRRACGHDDAFEFVVVDVLADQLLAGVRTHVLVLSGHHHSRKAARIAGQGMDVNDACDIGTAVTDVDADFWQAEACPTICYPMACSTNSESSRT